MTTAQGGGKVVSLTHIYTECNRRNGPYFGRVLLRSNYTDITQTPISIVERLQRYWAEKRVVFFGVCVLYSVGDVILPT